ncbi:hypothetical protein [Rhizobium phage RHph_X2_30]|nr:hypothetical protein [Rhizobium phage RHph_X2_30]
MIDLGLYEGCFVQLRDGRVVGPIEKAVSKWYLYAGERTLIWSRSGKSTRDSSYDIIHVTYNPRLPQLGNPPTEPAKPETVPEHVLAAAREAGLKARPAYDEFVAAIVDGALAAQANDWRPAMVLKDPERTGNCTFSEGELLDAISEGFIGGKQFANHTDVAQGKIRNVAANVMRLIEGAQNESETEIRPLKESEGGQSDLLFRPIDKLHPATRQFLQAIYPTAPLRAVEFLDGGRLRADYGNPMRPMASILVQVGKHGAIPMWIEEDGTYTPGAHPAAVEALIEIEGDRGYDGP